jgi:amino acid transporter
MLHRALTLRDVTLLGIACIVGTRWFATAAHAGPGAVTLFLLSGLFFVIPLARSVGALAARRPQAGGQYVWTRADFGDWHGFLAFWLYWVGIACWFPNAAIAYMSIGAYAIDPALVENRPLIVGASVAAIWIGIGVNLLGVRIGRWIQNAGSVTTWIVVALLLTAAISIFLKRGSATALNFVPPLNLATLNFWSQMSFALSGIELLGMMAAEIRDPERNITRAGWLAGIFAVMFYSTATLSLLVMVRPEQISIVYGIMQGARAGGDVLGLAWIPFAFALLSTISFVGQVGGLGAATSRLSYAAAQDGLLPAVFGRVHRRWRTPHISMLTLGGVATALLILMQLGDTLRAAYQELVSMMVLCAFMPYLYIFASAWKAGLRAAPVCGLVMTLMALAFSAFPTEEIADVWLFEAKTIGGFLLFLGLGRVIFVWNRRRG